MGFQKTINNTQAPGVAGDFASTNPFASVLAGPGQLVAPAGGLIVGNFAWVGPAGQVSQSFVAGYQIGFLGRNEQALITQFLGESSLLVPAGFPVTLFNGGDFLAKFAAGATPGNSVFADPNNGAPYAAASAPAGASVTGSGGATGTATTVNLNTTLTVNTVSAGIIGIGDTVVSANVPVGTKILAQLTVTAGSGAGILGTYQMSAAATSSAGPTAFTTQSTLVTVTAVASGALLVGDVISGTGVIAGTTILSQAGQFQGVANLATSTALNVTAVNPGSGKLRVGDTVTGTGIPAATTIASQTSGTPGGIGLYVLSAPSTVTQNGVSITDTNIPGQTGRYTVSNAANFASTTITVAGGSDIATGFKVRGTYTALDNEVAKISTL